MRDRDIRSALRDQQLGAHLADPDTLVVEELGLLHGGSRVDVAVVNGELHGFELKSASDTLARLPGQVIVYSAVLDRVTLVLAETHYRKAMDLVPPWWGVVLAAEEAGDIVLRPHRDPEFNAMIDPVSLARLLWRDEALAELELRDAAIGLRKMARRHLYARLAETLELYELRRVVRTRLKERSGWRVAAPRT